MRAGDYPASGNRQAQALHTTEVGAWQEEGQERKYRGQDMLIHATATKPNAAKRSQTQSNAAKRSQTQPNAARHSQKQPNADKRSQV